MITLKPPIIGLSPSQVDYSFDTPNYVPGDVWFAVLQVRAVSTLSVPAGWTQIVNRSASTSATGPRVYVFYRVPDGSEPSVVAGVQSGTLSRVSTVVYAISGVDTQVVLDTGVIDANGAASASTTLTHPGITTTTTDTLLLNIQAGNGTSGEDIVFTQPAGFTKELDLDSTYNDLNINSFYKTDAGPTGVLAGSTDVATRWVSAVIALRADGSVGNLSPTVSVGADITAAAGQTIQLSATATDPEGSSLEYFWDQRTGPSQSTISTASQSATNVSNLVQGTYIFRCTVADQQQFAAFDEVTVTVGAARQPLTQLRYRESNAWSLKNFYVRYDNKWIGGVNPVVTISAPTSGATGSQVTINANVTGGVASSWSWSDGAGFVSASPPPIVYTMSQQGSRTLTVTVQTSNGQASDTHTISITDPGSTPAYQMLSTYNPALASVNQTNFPVADGRSLTPEIVGIVDGTTLTQSTQASISTGAENIEFLDPLFSINNPTAGETIVFKNCRFRYGSSGGGTVEVQGQPGNVIFIDCEFIGDTNGGTLPYTSNLLVIRGGMYVTTCRCLFTRSGADCVRLGGVGYRSIQDCVYDLRNNPSSHRDWMQGYGSDTGSVLEVLGTRVTDPAPLTGSELSAGAFLDGVPDAEPIQAYYRGCALGYLSPVIAHGAGHPAPYVTDCWFAPYLDPNGSGAGIYSASVDPIEWSNNRWWTTGQHKFSNGTRPVMNDGDEITLSMAKGIAP